MTQVQDSNSADNKQTPPSTNQEQGDKEREGSKDTSKSKGTPKSKSQKQEAHYHPRDLLDKVNVGLLFGICLFTALAAIFTGLQLKDTKDTARRQLRAYVLAVPGNVYHIDGGNAPVEAYVGIRNYGQTLALDVVRTVGIEIFGPEIPSKQWEFWKPQAGTFVLGPGGENITIKKGPRLNQERSKKIRTRYDLRTDKKDLRIYVIGKIVYKDIWNDTHNTKFCFMYYGDETIPNFEPMAYSGTLHGKYCDKYNSAD